MDALETYVLHAMEKFENETSFQPRTIEPIPKNKLDGKQSNGVKFLKKFWFDEIPCSELPKAMLDILVSRHKVILEANKLWCKDRRFCKKKGKMKSS